MLIESLGWEDPLEKGTATHSSILTWRIPWTEEPGGLWSMGSQRVGHDWSNLAYTQEPQGLLPQVSNSAVKTEHFPPKLDKIIIFIRFEKHGDRSHFI